MSEFLDDTESLDVETDLELVISTLSAARKPREKSEPRSLQELRVHYMNFCANRDLDYNTSPEEQITTCDKDQKWLDAHVQDIQLAKRQKRLLARGKTDQLRAMLKIIRAKMGEEDEITDVPTQNTPVQQAASPQHATDSTLESVTPNKAADLMDAEWRQPPVDNQQVTEQPSAFRAKPTHKNRKPLLPDNQLRLF